MAEQRGKNFLMPKLINNMTPEELRDAVAEKYGQVAIHPEGHHPFPVGRAFAESLGYVPELLDSLPDAAVAAFAGISNPLAHADLQAGEIVLDLGCGAGMDTILAAQQVGLGGYVHSLDLSAAMLASAKANALAAGIENVTFHRAPADTVPLDNASVDVVIVNGIFNLCPAKKPVMLEIYRLLPPGGRLLVSEIVIQVMDDESMEGATCDLGSDALNGLTLEKWFQ
jgi:arsenite methyltransferase